MDCGGRVHIDDESALGIRDFSISFAADGCRVTEDLLVNLIQSQEKLCQNFGRKRKTIAIGIFRSDLIKYPVHYYGADPDKTAFVPLGMTEKLTLREILEKHPKGKEYGHIIADKPRYPYLTDDEVVSYMVEGGQIPPIEGIEEQITDPISQAIIDAALNASAVQLWYDQYLDPSVANAHLDGNQEVFGLTMTPEEANQMMQQANEEYLAE